MREVIRVNVKNTFLEFEDEEEKPAAGIPKSKSCPDLGSHRSFEETEAEESQCKSEKPADASETQQSTAAPSSRAADSGSEKDTAEEIPFGSEKCAGVDEPQPSGANSNKAKKTQTHKKGVSQHNQIALLGGPAVVEIEKKPPQNKKGRKKEFEASATARLRHKEGNVLEVDIDAQPTSYAGGKKSQQETKLQIYFKARVLEPCSCDDRFMRATCQQLLLRLCGTNQVVPGDPLLLSDEPADKIVSLTWKLAGHNECAQLGDVHDLKTMLEAAPRQSFEIECTIAEFQGFCSQISKGLLKYGKDSRDPTITKHFAFPRGQMKNPGSDNSDFRPGTTHLFIDPDATLEGKASKAHKDFVVVLSNLDKNGKSLCNEFHVVATSIDPDGAKLGVRVFPKIMLTPLKVKDLTVVQKTLWGHDILICRPGCQPVQGWLCPAPERGSKIKANVGWYDEEGKEQTDTFDMKHIRHNRDKDTCGETISGTNTSIEAQQRAKQAKARKERKVKELKCN